MATKTKQTATETNGEGHDPAEEVQTKPNGKCPISRRQFRDKATKSVAAVLNGVPLAAMYKEFSTGSLGWYLSGAMTIDVDGVPTPVQIGLNLTVKHSKELPK